jgi:hypothetical protein
MMQWSSYAGNGSCHCEPLFKKGKGNFYLTWGYNLDWYSKSDLHLKGNDFGGYDFTLYNAKAHDKPGLDHIFGTSISIPQYVYRAGYYFGDKHNLGIEIGFDHTKYIMTNNQRLHLKGRIGEMYYDQDTLVGRDFLMFEHTNGANFLMASLVKRFCLLSSASQNHRLQAIVKTGAGIVIPKTDVTLFGQRLDNRFHIAGYVAGVDAGFRYDIFKYFFVETTLKGVFANYTNVLTVGDGRANHHFFAGEYIFSAGLQIGL